MLPTRFFHPDYAPIYVPILLSLAGAIFFMQSDSLTLLTLLSNRWSLHYFLATPFIHGGAGHFLLNTLALHYIGGMMLLPLLGKKQFSLLLLVAAVTANLVNNLLSEAPAIGFSGAIMGVVACALYPYARAPMRLLFIHDILRLPPFQFRYIVAFIVALDILGIIFNWHFFAHWAHLGGFAAGLIFGALRFKLRLF